MRDLDETDMEILTLLAEDARRPFSDIGEQVGLSGPAVSDRVTRLQEAGIITNFTVNVDRGELQAGVPVFVQVECRSADAEAVRSRVSGADGVEHLFVTAEGEVWFYGRTEGGAVRQWVDGLLGDVQSAEYSVTLVDDLEWTPSLDGTEFAITCAECGNTVDSEGESARIDGGVYHFCCPSCRSQFEEQYRRIEEGT
ncbi:AsnC family transcriptional regulator [Halostella salina]|uniref:AsnC family transcriptional regulator n=1 Tax=Halostella salina TaxID=1547897 RepID=UPI000EF7D441|nr:AsnC family transcriptional regulator [Halostella salina]